MLVIDHKFHHLQQVRSALSFLTYPLHVIADLPVTGTRWFSEISSSRSSLINDNRSLRNDNLILKAELQKYESLVAENVRLRDLLDSSFKIGDRVFVAELSAVDLDPYKQQVVINKGTTTGVFEGQAVLDAHAVMGQVTSVSAFSATVLLITDSSHALPVQVLRSGLRTIAVGTGRVNELSLPYLPINADIQKGDLLVTSGLGGKFPSGYPVAEVTQLSRSPDNPFADVRAAPRAQLDRSREVLLVSTIKPTLSSIDNEDEKDDTDNGSDATETAPSEKVNP